MKTIAVITTVGSADDARRIAKELVTAKLAACAHVSELESFYVWKDALENDREFRVVLKTTEDRYDAVEAAIRKRHPYELPAIYAVTLDRVYAPYDAWVREGTQARQTSSGREGG